MRWFWIVTLTLCLGCSSTQDPSNADPGDANPDTEASTEDTTSQDNEGSAPEVDDEEQPSDPWQRVHDRLRVSDVGELSFVVGTADGVVFEFHKGGSTLTTSYATASAIKWVTSAVILRLVEEGLVELDANPQSYLDWWTSDPTDPRSRVTIRQLLAFTSGLSGTPFGDNTPACLEDADTTIDACAQFIYETAEAYFYGPSHMQILASIAQAVTGEPWAQLYTDRLAQPLGMEATLYDWPSESNPRLSAGAVSTVQDFQRFAQSMLINSHWPTTWDEMVTDHTPKESVTMAYSPLSDSTRGWHYGLGVWLECPNPNWEESCNTVGVISAYGMFGFHLWVDMVRGHYAVLAMEDRFSGWQKSLQLSMVLREDVAAAVLSD